MNTMQSMGMDERISIIREGRNILHECRNGMISAAVMQTTDGRYYALMLSSEGTGNAVFRRTSDKIRKTENVRSKNCTFGI